MRHALLTKCQVCLHAMARLYAWCQEMPGVKIGACDVGLSYGKPLTYILVTLTPMCPEASERQGLVCVVRRQPVLARHHRPLLSSLPLLWRCVLLTIYSKGELSGGCTMVQSQPTNHKGWQCNAGNCAVLYSSY